MTKKISSVHNKEAVKEITKQFETFITASSERESDSIIPVPKGGFTLQQIVEDGIEDSLLILSSVTFKKDEKDERDILYESKAVEGGEENLKRQATSSEISFHLTGSTVAIENSLYYLALSNPDSFQLLRNMMNIIHEELIQRQ